MPAQGGLGHHEWLAAAVELVVYALSLIPADATDCA